MFREIAHQLGDHIAPSLIDQLPAFPMAVEQPGLLQGFQMKRQGRERQAEPLTNLAGGLRSGLRQMAENLQPGVLRERCEYSDGG